MLALLIVWFRELIPAMLKKRAKRTQLFPVVAQIMA